jgi:radical SAM superfamily enzyme YgiQ (UPF0313 family)
MAKYVLVADTTLSREYRNFPLLDFLPSAPSDRVPTSIYRFLRGNPPPAIGGRASKAPYALRKLEAGLLREYDVSDVVVAHEDYIADFVDDDTELIGVTTMDPLGLAPLSMSFAVFFKSAMNTAYVRKDFVDLIGRVNRIRSGKKAKLLVGGPGVWEFTVMPEELDNLGIDCAYQGEADDIIIDLFRHVVNDERKSNLFQGGFQTFDDHFHRQWVDDGRFLSRYQFSKQFPKLEEIPDIVNPSIKGMVEVMRGCGIGCDFCEVTLRPLRYYSPERVRREVQVNAKVGQSHAWLHSDEIFAYHHGPHFEPNGEALVDLFSAVMSTKGLVYANPTHGRISIPAAYPDLVRKLSKAMDAGPNNWIGMQVGIETGSDRLAAIHMPNKTLPLRVGPDGSWAEIVWRGTYILNKYYWRPAFTVQVGQAGETPEDNWETVALINIMSNSEVEGRPFEFTATPMQNVPLGRLRSRDFSSMPLDESQLAVYYACYRHLYKVAMRNAMNPRSNGTSSMLQIGTGALLGIGAWAMMRVVGIECKKGNLDLDKAATYGLDRRVAQTPQLTA